MQVVFSIEEFRLLVHILREHSEQDTHPDTSLRNPASALLEKVLARDFCFSIDELEDLEEILQQREKRMKREMADGTRPHTAEELHEENIMEHVLDRVTEACAMG